VRDEPPLALLGNEVDVFHRHLEAIPGRIGNAHVPSNKSHSGLIKYEVVVIELRNVEKTLKHELGDVKGKAKGLDACDHGSKSPVGIGSYMLLQQT